MTYGDDCISGLVKRSVLSMNATEGRDVTMSDTGLLVRDCDGHRMYSRIVWFRSVV